ncbi:MAG: segregation/condensation protein A [Oscillospiraceae bacterium]
MENPTFHLEGVVKSRDSVSDFEGPLSLILMLLSKNKIEIRDISVSGILSQYLAWLSEMERMDMEVASEFVQMASYLLYIKTKTLLVAEEEISELSELMTSLEQLKCRELREKLKSVTPTLAAASELGLLLRTRAQEPLPAQTRVYDYRHEPEDLLASLYSVFSRGGAKTPGPPELRSIAPPRIVYGIREKSREILARLRGGGSVTLRALYEAGASRSEVVATFISVLELCSIGGLHIDEDGDDFLLSFAGGDADEILASIEE